MSYLMTSNHPTSGYISAKDTLFIAAECHRATNQDEDGDTLLHLAVVQGSANQCRQLCQLFCMAKKSVDAYNKLIQTPLHIATITNKPDIVEILMEYGANPNAKDRYGSTCLHLTAKFNATECLLLFIERCKPQLALKARNYEGLTALHVAVIESSLTIFKILVANGAEIDAKDTKSGRTPLIYAIERGRLEFVERLLECEANVSQQTFSGDTALHIASGRGYQDIVRLLLRRGADASAKNIHNDSTYALVKPPVTGPFLSAKESVSSSSKSAMYFAEAQYQSHIVKNTNLPMPPHLLPQPIITHSGPTQARVHLIGKQKIKEEPQDEIPRKRHIGDYKRDIHAMSGYSRDLHGSASLLQQQIPLLPPILHIPNPPSPYTEPRIQNTNSSYTAENKVPAAQSDATESKESTNLPGDNPSDQNIEPNEQMIVAAEEVVCSGEASSPEKTNQPFVKFKNEVTEQVQNVHLEHTSPIEQTLKEDNSPVPPVNEKSSESSTQQTDDVDKNKAVIVQYSPQVLEPTALKTETPEEEEEPTATTSSQYLPIKTEINYTKNETVKVSTTTPLMPFDDPLFQLAKQGMAAAEVLAQINSGFSLNKSFAAANLKRGPSRQAKIKSGTTELQNLALQGLAVAAMNTKSEEAIEQEKRNSDLTSDRMAPSNVTQIPNHLSKVFDESNQSLMQIHRSHSLPNGVLIKSEPEIKATTDRQKNLLALANATVKKQNVGQAVSAFTGGPITTADKTTPQPNALIRSNSGPSKQTKLSLRNAIMEKPITMSKISNPSGKASKMFKGMPTTTDTKVEEVNRKVAKVHPSTPIKHTAVHATTVLTRPIEQPRAHLYSAANMASHMFSPPGHSVHKSTTSVRPTVNESNQSPQKPIYIVASPPDPRRYELAQPQATGNPSSQVDSNKILQSHTQTTGFIPHRYMQQVVYMPYGRQHVVPYIVPVTVSDTPQLGISPMHLQHISPQILQQMQSAQQATVIASLPKDPIVEKKEKEIRVAPVATTSTSWQKPIATVIPQNANEMEEQPLNLSKKADKPLNLITSPKSISRIKRPSVIKEVTANSSLPTTTQASTTSLITQPAGLSLPPPFVLPQPLQPGGFPSAALAAYSYLPPIHYVPGMPLICPTTTAQPKPS